MIARLEGKTPEEYYKFRTTFITFVHKTEASVSQKVLALETLLSEKVLKTITEPVEYTSRGYLNLVRALERRYGGHQRLLKTAVKSIRDIDELRVDRITDLERYVQMTNSYRSRLTEAGLRNEFHTLSTLQDMKDPLPDAYIQEYHAHIRREQEPDDADNLLSWAMEKLEVLRDAYESKGPRKIMAEDSKKRIDKGFRSFKPRKWQAAIDHVTQIQGEQRDGTCLSDSSNPDETVTEDDDEQVLTLNAGKTWERKCQICSGPNQPADHVVTECKAILCLPVEKRRNLFASWSLCFKCGKSGHRSPKCQYGKPCSTCQGNHHDILHTEESVLIASGANKKSLMTVTTKVLNPKNKKEITINCLLDSGSSISLLSTRTAKKLGLIGYPSALKFQGAGGNVGAVNSFMSIVNVQSVDGSRSTKMAVQIMKDPAGTYEVTNWEEQKRNFPFMENIEFSTPVGDRKINLLIGCNYPELMTIKASLLSEDKRTGCVLTPLGWSALGHIAGSKSPPEGIFFLQEPSDRRTKWFQHHAFTNEDELTDNLQPEEGLNEGMERVSATAPTPEIFTKMDEMVPETDGLMMIGNGIDVPVCSKEEEDDYKKTLELQMLKSIGKSMEREWIVENQGEDTEQSRDEQHALDTAKSTREKVGEKYGISCLWKKGCPSLKSNVNYVKSHLDALMRMKCFIPAPSSTSTMSNATSSSSLASKESEKVAGHSFNFRRQDTDFPAT
mgnify:FL=1